MSAYVPDDNEARLLLRTVEREQNPERQALMLDGLTRYRDAKQAAGLEPFKPDPAIARQARERLEGLYDGLDQIDARLEPAQREGFNAAVEASADRDEVKARMVNQAWVMQEFPHLADAVDTDWTATKHHVAKQVFGSDATEIPDTAFYGQIGGRIKQQKAEREMMTDVLTKIQVEAAKGTGNWLEAWKKAATGLSSNPAWNAANHDRYRAAAQKVFADTQKNTEALRPAITTGQEFYRMAAAGTAEMEEINAVRTAFIEELKRLPRAQQDQALTLAIAGSSDLAPKPRGERGEASLPEKMAVSLERAIGEFPRSVFRLGKAAGAAGAELASTVRLAAGTGTAEEMYAVQRGAREIELERLVDQGLRDAVDPVASKNRLAQGMIDAMESVPYMATAATGAGIPLTLAAMAEDNRAKFIDAGVPEAEALTLGLAAAAPQVAVERLQANMVFRGKLPGLDKWLTKIVTTKTGLAAKMLAVGGIEAAQQNIEEAVQDITPAVYQELGSALSQDVPDVDWATEMAAYKNGRVDTFFALLPMVMLGTGTASFREAAFAREYLSREKVLKAAGFTEKAAAQIAEAATKGDVELAQTLVQTGWDNPEVRPDALKERESAEAAADLASVESYNSEAQRLAFDELDAEMQASWNEQVNPTGARAVRNEDGSWTVVDANEQVVDTTQDAEQAVELVKQVDMADAASMTAVADDMIDYFKQRGRGGEIEKTSQVRTLEDDVKAGRMTADAAQRIVDLYVSLGALEPGTKPKEARIYGESERRYNAREKVFEYVSRLHEGADPLVLVEEEAEGYFKAALDAAEFTLDRVEEWRAEVEGRHIVRRQDEAMRKRENVEWFSTYAKAYLTGKAQADRSIPLTFRRWLDKMRQVFAEVFKLARDLMEMEQAGTLPADFRTHLARSVGLDEAFIERRMREEERQAAQEGVADQYTAREALLKIKLPTPKKETAGMRGELMNLWESMKFDQRMKLFSAKAKSLDAVAEVLRSDYGFSWVTGPDQVVQLAEDTFLRGKDIRSDVSGFQEATGAVRKKPKDQTTDMFDSGMAEEDFRLWGGTAEDASGAVDAEEARREAKRQADAEQGQATFALRKQPDGELLAVHNTSADKLRQMDELGGMAAPSIAVIKPGTSEYSSFGDITLIAPPEVIDPRRSAAAKVFNADVYSPRFPNTQYKVNRKALDAAWKKLNDASGQLGNVLSSSLDEDAVSKDGLLAFKDAAVVKLAFLKAKGITPDIRMRKTEKVSAELARFTGKTAWEISDNPEFQKAAADYYRESYKNHQDLLEDILDEQGQVMSGPLNRLARNVYDINNPEPDRYESNGAFQTQIEQAGLLDEFDAWVRKEFGGVVAGKVVRDYNERTGNTRSLPYDLDTVVRVMKRELRDGEGFNYGVGSIRATVAKQFRSLSAIREAASSIQKKESIEALKEETNDEFMALANELAPFYRYDSNRFGYLDEVSQSFKELGQYNGAAKWAENFKDTPPELMQRVRDFMLKLANAPTEYFEAKVQRGVLLNELAGAVIPSGTPDDVREILRKHGLKFVEYPKGDEKARAAAVAGFTGQTFAIGPANRAEQVKEAMRTRMIGIRVQASTNFSDEVKKLVGLPEYEVRGMDVNEKEAKKIITSNDGDLAKLMDVLNDPTQTMHPATKVALAFFVAEAANKVGDYARAAEVAKTAAEQATSAGQSVNELKRWSVFTNPQTTQKLLQTEIEKENNRRKEREPAIKAVVTVYADVQKEALKLLKQWLDEINGVKADVVQPVTADELAELADVTFALRADIKASGLVEQVAKLLKKHGAEATERALVEKYGTAVEQHLPDLFIEAQRTLTGRKKARKAASRIPEQAQDHPSPRTPEEIEAAMDAQREAGEGAQALADLPELYDRLFEHLMLRLKDANVPTRRGIREQVMEVLNRHGLQATEEDVKLIMGARSLIPDMTPAQAEELANYARRIASTPLDSFERGQQTMELFSYVHDQLAPYDLVDVAFGLWYANVLSSLITSARNITGNAGLLFLDQATETIFRNPARYWPYLTQLAKAAESGAAGAIPQAANTMRTGQEGLQRSQSLADERRQGALESKTAPLAKVRAISRIATRFLATQDLFFANTAYEMKARQIAWDQANREVDAGTLKPEQVEERVARLLNAATDQIQTFEDRAAVEWGNLTPEIQATYSRDNWIKRRVNELRLFERDKQMVGRALDFAQKATLDYEPEGLMGLLIGSLGRAFTTAEKAAQEIGDKRVRFVAKGAAKYGRTRVIPFMRVPVNVFNRALDYGPVGYARAMMDAMGVPVIVGAKTRVRTAEERSDLLKRATLGTLAMIPLALLTRPPEPDEEKEEYPWLQIHGAGSGTPQKNLALNGPKYRPYSLELRVGGKQVFIDYRMAPVAPYLATIGTLHDKTRYKKAVDDKTALVEGWLLAHALKEGFMSSSPITSLRELSEAAAENNPMSERAVNRTLARGTTGVVGNLIPLAGLWRSLDQIAGGNRNTRDTLLAASMAEIPVASRLNVPSVDVLGDIMTNRGGIGWLMDWSAMETPESRIYMAFAEKDVTPSDLTRFQNKLTPEQFYDFARERGAQIKTVMLTRASDGKTGLERLQSLSDKPVVVGGDSPAKVFMRRLSEAATKRALEKTGLDEVLKPEVLPP